MTTRVLVCGGRDYNDRTRAYRVLDDTLKFYNNDILIIQGDAKGADYLAKEWAIDRNVPHDDYPANWKKHGRAAGPVRNKQMRDEGKPDLVIAFPGGTGTAGMIKLAEEKNIKVVKIS